MLAISPTWKARMKTTHKERYARLVNYLVQQRKAAGLNQQYISDQLGLDQSSISRYENCELRLDIELLAQWCETIDASLESAIHAGGYIGSLSQKVTTDTTPISNDIAIPDGAKKTNAGFDLVLRWKNDRYHIPFPESDYDTYCAIEKAVCELFSSLNNAGNKKTNREAISEALQLAISMMPEANPSDIYHHIIYRLYIREYKRTNPKQSWVRAGGEAVELFFKRHYGPLLASQGISIQLAFETKERNKFLTEMNLADQVAGGSKLDICLYGTGKHGLVAFGGVHSKASLAERVSDDKPCSERMMAAGFKSYLFTFDAKSFPPPTGSLINSGELGTIETPSDKREYIEKHGSFDACFSYNTRTVASGPKTKSGKRIFTSRFDEADALVAQVTNDWRKWKAIHGL